MTRIITVDKEGSLKCVNARDLAEESLYKRAGLRKPSDKFARQAGWTVDGGMYEVWGKKAAMKASTAGQENKYDFPPPIDTLLMSGTVIIVKRGDDGSFLDLSTGEWATVYEALFGGFEDLGENDSFSSDELDMVPDDMKTKDGYLKDGFVVDSEGEIEEEDYISD